MNPELGRKATNDEDVGQTTLPDILFVRPSLQMNFKLTNSVCSSIPIIFSVRLTPIAGAQDERLRVQGGEECGQHGIIHSGGALHGDTQYVRPWKS